jgi:hypothetical protein
MASVRDPEVWEAMLGNGQLLLNGISKAARLQNTWGFIDRGGTWEFTVIE